MPFQGLHVIFLSVTHWGRDKVAANFLTTFQRSCYWTKMYEFRLRFHWSLFLRVKVTIFQHWLTHWARVALICVGKLSIIGSDNALSPGRRQAIIWTNAGILLIGSLRTNFSEIWVGNHILSSKKIHLKKIVWKMSAILIRPQGDEIMAWRRPPKLF